MEIKPSKYKGIELTYEIKEHKKNVDAKVTLSFHLLGSDYNNAAVLPLKATESEWMVEIKKLDKWAHTIINDNIIK